MNLLQLGGIAVLLTALGFGSGWLVRGDCAKEVRATEAVATAQADTKAETIIGEVKLADVQIKINFDTVFAQIDSLPPETAPLPGCPARELDADELRLWNASNQGGHLGVQPAGTDGAGPGHPPAAEPEREASGP